MKFCIADSFTKALGKLTAQEQSAAKITALDLQLNPAAPGLQFHRIDKSKTNPEVSDGHEYVCFRR